MANHSGPMACPVDGAALVMSERSGIEIDYCPTCRGVWLDRGELDKIIERNAASQAPSSGAAATAARAATAGRPVGQPAAAIRHGYGHKPYKRRKSFLEDLFD